MLILFKHICVYLIANRTLVNVVLFVHDLAREGSILPDSEHVKMNVDTSDLVKVRNFPARSAQPFI